MKQVFHNKGATSDRGVLQDDPERFRFEFDGTKLKSFPIPLMDAASRERVIALAGALDSFGSKIAGFSFTELVDRAGREGLDLSAEIKRVMEERRDIREQMVRWQEELDWLCYELYGLMEASESARSMIHGCSVDEMPPLDKNLRVYRDPDDFFPDDLGRARRNLLETNQWIALIERPEYKRRWFRSAGAYDERDLTDEIQFPRWMRDWLLDHLEGLCHAPELVTCAQLAERARHDPAFQQVGSLYAGSDTFDARTLVSELVAEDQVPQMAAARYTADGLTKFRAWQETWDLQRAEDAIDARTALDPSDPKHLSPEDATALKARTVGDIPLPPKYGRGDFQKASYWGLRGKLDVPKERFFSLPGCERAGDQTLVIGWAGLDHLARARAIAGWYIERKTEEGWDAQRLKPMLVALDELIPWLKQWHNAFDPEYGACLGDFYEGFLLEELRTLDLSRDELGDWRPPAAPRGRRPK